MASAGRSGYRARPNWRRYFPLLFGIVLLALMPAIVRAQTADSVVVSWTAPGDDGQLGAATSYDLRVSEQPIDAGNFASALVVPQLPSPQQSGTQQRVVVRGLSRDRTYYFAIRSVDNLGNWSGLSNVVRWDWTLDAAPPSTPRNVRARREGDNVVVDWDSNAEPDLAGYNVYRSVQGGATERVNGSLVLTSEFVDVGAATSTEITYEVTAVDQRGNESARSLRGAFNLIVLEGWAIQPGYPNPSRAGENVHLPVVVPATADGDARLEILDSGGRLVRRLDMPSPQPGVTDMVWDGRNDAGRMTVPGVYRGWLIAGDTRVSVRLLRAP